MTKTFDSYALAMNNADALDFSDGCVMRNRDVVTHSANDNSVSVFGSSENSSRNKWNGNAI